MNKNFIEQTAKDYCMSYEGVEKIYKFYPDTLYEGVEKILIERRHKCY